MSEGSFRCPNCGSSEFLEIGSRHIKCTYCHTMFQERPVRPGSSKKKLVMLKGEVVKKCPYCSQTKPLEEFKDDICLDCYQQYRQAAKSSERDRISAEIEDESMTNKAGRWVLFTIYGCVFVIVLIGSFVTECC